MRCLDRTLLGFSAYALIGCGSAPQTEFTQDADSGVVVEIVPAVNVCPYFERALIIPQAIAPGVSAVIVVKATDPDGVDSSLVYDWSAASGSFSTPNRPTTTYKCGALGAQVLTATAEDVHGCRGQLALDVTCTSQ